MRIAVCSDSHNGLFHIERFMDFCKSEKIDQIIHNGDVVEDAQMIAKELDIPVAYVAGNCDYYSGCDREKMLEIEGHKILMTHGDRWRVKSQLDSLSYHASEIGAEIVCFGHTHRQFCGYVGDTLLINPGALKDGGICLLEITEKDVIPKLMDIDLWFQNKEVK